MIDLTQNHETTDLQDALAQAMRAVRRDVDGAGQSCQFALPRPGWRLQARPAEVQQMLTRLLRCASRAAGPEGRLSFACARCDGELVVCLTDSGGGITPAHRERIFEPPFRHGPEPAIVRAWAHVLGGSLVSRAEAGRRGSLCLTLPLARWDAPAGRESLSRNLLCPILGEEQG